MAALSVNSSQRLSPLIEIPPERLSPGVLQAILEEFVSREGTDYGEVEYSLERKVAQLQQQLSRGELVVSFDPQAETCTVLSKRDFAAAQADVDAGKQPWDD